MFILSGRPWWQCTVDIDCLGRSYHSNTNTCVGHSRPITLQRRSLLTRISWYIPSSWYIFHGNVTKYTYACLLVYEKYVSSTHHRRGIMSIEVLCRPAYPYGRRPGDNDRNVGSTLFLKQDIVWRTDKFQYVNKLGYFIKFIIIF